MKIRNIIIPAVIFVLMAVAGIVAAASPLKPTDAAYVNAPTIAPVMQPSVTPPPSPPVTFNPKQTTPAEWVWPCPSCKSVTAPFGMRYHPLKSEYVFCDHISIGAHDGDSVLSAISGDVTNVGTDDTQGNYIVIRNKDGISTTYQHLKAPSVYAGYTVKAGDLIGTVGSTGNVTGSCLDFSVYVKEQAVDPMSFYKDIG